MFIKSDSLMSKIWSVPDTYPVLFPPLSCMGGADVDIERCGQCFYAWACANPNPSLAVRPWPAGADTLDERPKHRGTRASSKRWCHLPPGTKVGTLETGLPGRLLPGSRAGGQGAHPAPPHQAVGRPVQPPACRAWTESEPPPARPPSIFQRRRDSMTKG